MKPKAPQNKYFCICLNLDRISNIPKRYLKLQKTYDIMLCVKTLGAKVTNQMSSLQK